MNFALITDKSGMEPYYSRGGKVYRYDNDEPFVHEHSLGNECYMGFWNYPVLFDGWFLNYQYMKTTSEFPDVDMDLIFLSHQRKNSPFPAELIRKKYPNAIICSITQETFIEGDVLYNNFKSCDIVLGCYSDTSRYDNVMRHIPDKKMHWMPEPFNVDYLNNKYYTGEKDLSIFSYNVWYRPQRQGRTEEFANYIGEKYKISVKRTWTGNRMKQWCDFLDMWTPHAFHFNLDPEPHPGDQAIQCAIVGTINVGGNNDSHKVLFPETYGNNFENLEEKVKLYLTNQDAYHEAITYAWNKVNEIYSFDAVRSRINNLVENYRESK
tara:strand:- start:3934 stop:4902 length:969 start_codon:yes stop_codon:yes gene_type:complete